VQRISHVETFFAATENRGFPGSMPRDAFAMPVILTMAAEIEQWMTTPADEAIKLQRPVPDGTLKIVATGEKEDQAA
jgi:hypothetical protein